MFQRSPYNPILKPIDNHPWESLKVYNPAIIQSKGEYHLFYRGVGENLISNIGYAYSFDGEKFIRYNLPLLEPSGKMEQNGVEDPRITKLEKTYFMTYTAYDGICARLCLATSDDLKNWKKRGLMIPDWNGQKAKSFIPGNEPAGKNKLVRKEWVKSGAIFPEKIDGQYWMLFGDSNIWLATSNNGINWSPVWKPFLEPRNRNFDNLQLEMGPPPIKTEKGWLIIYHGIDKYLTYQLGCLLLDLKNPAKIIYRSKEPIFYPEMDYELEGIVDVMPGGLKRLENMDRNQIDSYRKDLQKSGKLPKIVFCCGSLADGKKLRIYYGAADTVVATAMVDLEKILNRNV